MTKIFIIHPLVGVGSIAFGMTPDEVERAIGAADFATPPNRFFGDVVRRYPSAGVLVTFDAEGAAIAVSSSPPEGASLQSHGLEITSLPYSEFARWLQQNDARATVDGDSARSDALGIYGHSGDFYVPGVTAPSLEAVVVYRAGYFARTPRR
jgi:hypothetical protein